MVDANKVITPNKKAQYFAHRFLSRVYLGPINDLCGYLFFPSKQYNIVWEFIFKRTLKTFNLIGQ